MILPGSEKGALLLGAREAIQSLLNDTISPVIDYTSFPNLREKCGAFVTLTKKGNLRGCIGYIASDMTLFQTVCEAAKQAAVNDPRFSPVTDEEFRDIDIEISVISPFKPIKEYSEIEIGTHGLLLEELPHRGLLLPQVAVENSYTVERFLSALCDKAGLPAEAWEKKVLNIKTFTAEVFSEEGNRKITHERI